MSEETCRKKLEKATWDGIKETWERIKAIEVPEEKEKEIDDLLFNYGTIVVSDGVGFDEEVSILTIRPTLDTMGKITFEDDNSGDEIDFEDLKLYNFDPFCFWKWLDDLEKIVKKELKR